MLPILIELLGQLTNLYVNGLLDIPWQTMIMTRQTKEKL